MRMPQAHGHQNFHQTATTDSLSYHAISQYDVLLVERENELVFIPHNHVGNNRLGLFVKMNLQEFIHCDDIDGQNQVIRNLIGIVQRQCVDDQCQRAGKFLYCRVFGPEKLLDNDTTAWTEVTTAKIVDFLRNLFEQEQFQLAKISSSNSPSRSVAESEPAGQAHQQSMTVGDDEKKRRRRSSLLRRSLSSGNMIEDQKKRIAHRKSILLQLQQYDVSEEEETTCSDEEEDDEKMQPQREAKLDANSNNSQPTLVVQSLDEPNQDPTPSTSSPDSPSKSSPNLPTTNIKPNQRLERRSSFGDVPQTVSSATVIHTANALDVIIERSNHTDAGGYQLSRHHTGNNRLSVMMELRQNRYRNIASNKMEVHRLCLDLIHMVSEHYNGRFLLEETNGTFLALADEQAVAAIASIFEDTLLSTPPVSQNMVTLLNASSSSLQSNDNSLASSLPSTLQVPVDVHKAALASLHRRKKRQDTSSKLSQVASRNREMHEPLTRRGEMLEARALSVGAIEDTNPNNDAMLLQQPSRVQRRASVGMLQDRRPTLSSFSQDMIRDMLLQLDESHSNTLSPLAGELDDLF